MGRVAIFLWAALGLAPSSAQAAGGAHVIDDAAVETPGTCHIESWASGYRRDEGFANVGIGCTPTQAPDLELGGYVAHDWSPQGDDTTIGVSPKLVLRSADHGIGIGIGGSIGFGIDRGRFESAALIMPFTIAVNDRLRLNANAGWQWIRADHAHELLLGAQAEFVVARDLGLMVESFARDEGRAGAQAGLRWTVAGGDMDIDLLAARYIDGKTPTALTLGLTWRY
ncbi:MAG: hypothetical protein JWR77_41 [Rhizorhabdus sp.]|nr:hypothetical protein [Rhizorhabdus sp.]